MLQGLCATHKAGDPGLLQYVAVGACRLADSPKQNRLGAHLQVESALVRAIYWNSQEINPVADH